MATVKGKLSKPFGRIEDRATRKSGKAGLKGFKVYVETDMAEVCSDGSSDTQQKIQRASAVAPGRKSVTFSERITQAMTSDLKGGAKTSENQKAKRDSSMNIGRRALADVSNLRGQALMTKGRDGLKQMTTAKKTVPLTRKSVTLNTVSKVDAAASDEKRRVRESRRQVVAVYPTLSRGSRDFKHCVGDQRSKIQSRESFNTDSYGVNSRNPLPLSRKSLPVSKLSTQVGMGNKKAITGNAEKGTKGVHGFPVKAKVGRKVMPQVTDARAHLWKNRVSDGFILMASKNQSAVKGRAFSRKSVKPVVKTAYGMSSAKTNIKSKGEKESSLCGSSRTTDEPHSVADASSDCKENTRNTNKLEKDSTKKSRRRKSFTSLLMARSEVQDEKSQCLSQKLPSIYDDGNPNEVSEYVDEIYQYHWTLEAQSSSLANYMEMQAEITPQMRAILINWLIEVHVKFDLMPETLYLTVTLLDRYLSLVAIKKTELQLVGLTALLLASKYEDFWHPRVSDLISISVETYARDQMLEMEKIFLKKLKFRLNAPTPYIFMLRFLKASNSDKKLEDLSFYLIDLCMVDYEALRYKASLLCASAIYVARCTLEKIPLWSQLLCIYSHYDESQLRDCAEKVLKVQKSAKTSKLDVTYEKYSRPEYSQVAKIKPLNKLPLN